MRKTSPQRTDEQRRRHREIVQRLRARQAVDRAAERSEREFIEFCRTADVPWSPQSSLNPYLLQSRIDSQVRTRNGRMTVIIPYGDEAAEETGYEEISEAA